MKRVALINPGLDSQYAISEPLNLGFIASYLESHGIEVKIIDELSGENVEKELNDYKPSVVGITATTMFALDAYRVAKLAKNMNIKTVMGGVHASVLPEEALKHVDIVVKGEGEKAMYDIIQQDIKHGIVSSDYIKNIDEIPPPARHLMNMEFYLYTKDRVPGTHLFFVPPKTRCASILTTRGCPYSCIFCHNSWRGLPVRFNSPERVIEEIISLINNYKIQALFFMDDNIFASKERLKKICYLLKKENINLMWGCQARVDNIDEETLFMIKEAGCAQINFGFESGSQRILDILKNKTITVSMNKEAIRLSKKAGLIVFGTFMIGNPTETKTDIKMTIDFIRNTQIDAVGIMITTPYPGTKLWQWCEEKKLIPKEIKWSDFTTGRAVIPCSENFSISEISKLYSMVIDEIFYQTPLSLKDIKFYMKPVYFSKFCRNPLRIFSFIKRFTRRTKWK